MKNLVLLTLVLFSISNGFSQFQSKENSLTSYSLKGNVKTLTEIISMGKLINGKFLLDSVCSKRVTHFDKAGYVTEETVSKYWFLYKTGSWYEEYKNNPKFRYNSDGSIINDKKTYRYDVNNHLIEKSYYGRNCNCSLDYKYTYVYNEKGNIIEENFGLGYFNKFSYDDNGNLVEKSKFRLGMKDSKDVYNYSNNRLIEIRNYYTRYDDVKGAEPINQGLKEKYEYDSKGNLIEMNQYSSNGILTKSKSYKDDESDNIKVGKSYLVKSLQNETTYDYLYDSFNWIQQFINGYNESYGNWTYFIKREIEYY